MVLNLCQTGVLADTYPAFLVVSEAFSDIGIETTLRTNIRSHCDFDEILINCAPVTDNKPKQLCNATIVWA